MRLKHLLSLAALCSALVVPARADGLAALEAFLRETQSARADFTQVVTAPPREGQVARTRNSAGTFEFQRPGRFRFVYGKPLAQTIVADGGTTALMSIFRDFRQETGMTFGASSLATVMQMVAGGYGLTLIPQIAADVEERDERVKILRLQDPQPGRSIGLAFRKTSPRRADFAALGEVVKRCVAVNRS